MNRQRLFIRFKKEGDLRLISHRDLARAFERLFRRIPLPLAMSEGFHPHAKITFPSALALGIEGMDEIVEVELRNPVDMQIVQNQLSENAPQGLTICDVRELLPRQKSKLTDATYQIRIPRDQLGQLSKAMDDLLHSETIEIERSPKKKVVNIRPGILKLELHDDVLSMKLQHTQDYNVKPREVLQVLRIDNLERNGLWLTRTRVGLESMQESATSNTSRQQFDAERKTV